LPVPGQLQLSLYPIPQALHESFWGKLSKPNLEVSKK